MSKITENILSQIRQDKRRDEIEKLFDSPWITLYRYDGDEAWYSGLLTKKAATSALKKFTWEIGLENIRPSVVSYGTKGRLAYERFPRDGVEPLVLVRHKEDGKISIELSEELRLFLNIFRDEEENYYRITDGGDREVVVKIVENEVKILKAPLRWHLRARQMYLAIYFDHVSWFPNVRGNPLQPNEQAIEVTAQDRNWYFGATDDFGELFSRLCGKRLLAPEKLTRDTEDDGRNRYADFIIGYDAEGHHIEHNSNPAKLADFFGKNPDAPNYLTPVHFRREVLDRYFHDPSRFNVSDGIVRRNAFWHLQMDDDHSDRVVVFLGDLGRDLPYTEQLHWRANNIPPEGSLSKTARARSFDATFADGELPEHRFKISYQRLAEDWIVKHGWPLFRPLTTGDEYILTKIHVPTGNNPAELDAQILGLAKILIDSLNDSELDAALASPIADEKSLSKLERYLSKIGYRATTRDIELLKSIQSLRSTGVAHKRGSNYEKILKKLNLSKQPAQVIVTQFLSSAVTMMEDLRNHIQP